MPARDPVAVDRSQVVANPHEAAATDSSEEVSPVSNLVTASRSQPQSESVQGRADLAKSLQQALEAQHLIQEILESRTRQQATIVRLGMEALASSNLANTLDLLVREASATLGADFCSVLQLGADRKTFQLRADFGGPPGLVGTGVLTTFGDAQANYTLHAAAPVVVADLRSETRFNGAPAALEYGVVSGMSVILHGKQQAWGVVGTHSKTKRTFTEDDSNFLQAVANLMALAIERDRVETTLRNRNRQQAAVAHLGQNALTGPHMDDFFGDAVRVVAETLDVDACDLLQLQRGETSLLLRAGVGWKAGLVGALRVAGGMNSQVSFALNSKAAVIVTDQRTESRFDSSEILRDHEILSGMKVVIPGRLRPFGVLGAHTRSPRIFSLDDANFLQAVANILAAAIERHGAEGELRRHRDDLEGLVEERTALLAASNRELAAFSYTISHDLRAPLRSINGLSNILQRKHGESLSPDAKGMLQQIADDAVGMGKLIESILSLSRLGSVSLAHVPFDVSGAATATLQTLQARDTERKVEWTVEPGLHVVGDEGLLRLLLENLLGNAWKFTGRTKHARITVGREAGGFCVKDNGAGFDMAHARELFQPFHRLHAADEFEGTGIGLATVSRIVGRHGGRVWAEGMLGQGATFRVTLPPGGGLSPPPSGINRLRLA